MNWILKIVLSSTIYLLCRGEVLSTTTHVIIPLKNPQSFDSLDTLWKLANHSFGQIVFHFGIDWDDAETTSFIKNNTRSAWNYRVYKIFNRRGDTSMITNHIIQQIHERSYFFRFNDDTIMKTPNWNEKAIGALNTGPHINVGLAKITDITNTRIQTHPFFSIVHKDIFGCVFPVHFHNWYNDDWITRVYDGFIHDTSVYVEHKHVPERYSIVHLPIDVLDDIVADSRHLLTKYMYNEFLESEHYKNTKAYQLVSL